MERGVLFLEVGKVAKESQKRFCFADVRTDVLWGEEEDYEVSREEALHYDVIIRDIILKYF